MKQLIRHILREHTREIYEMRKLTAPEWLTRFKLKHGDKYDYSNSEFKGGHDKIIISCPIHGEFTQTPTMHKSQGCPKCSGKGKSTEDFISDAKKVHGDKYDYSKTDYKGSKNKVIIVCKKHGEFKQLPYEHIQNKSGCPVCSGNQKLSSTDFIDRAKKVHGDEYNYDKSVYLGAHKPIEIGCKIHGYYFQEPSNHLMGKGCPYCGGRYRPPIEEFIERAKSVHSNKYDYSKTNFSDDSGTIKIICPIHGEFLQNYHNHLSGKGCEKCGRLKAARSKTFSNQKFIDIAKKVHDGFYDYSKVNYKKNTEEVIIICPTHGEFLQKPGVHKNGAGCPKCAGVAPHTTKSFIIKSKEIHGEKYDYSKVDYKKNDEDVTIICKKHGEFTQRPANHLNGAGCPYCLESKGEKFITNLLDKHKINFIRQKKFDDCTNELPKFCRKLPFDFYIASKNVVIEFDGRQHFEPVTKFGGLEGFENVKRTDKIKNQYCKKNGIKLIRIPYTMKKEEIEPYILKELGIK